MKISVIMPVWNEAARVGPAVERLMAFDLHEVLVVDCGSHDGTALMARRAGARVLQSERGRWLQMNTGAERATGDVLWFVHADVQVPGCAVTRIRETLIDGDVVAGAFQTRTVEDLGTTWVRHFLPLADFRSRYTRLPYGDQAIFVRAEAFHAVGGFQPQQIMEDLELARSLSRAGRIDVIAEPVQVSGRRFVAHPVFTTLVMYSFPVLYWLGVSAETLERWYGAPR